MKSVVAFDFACNDPDNGYFAGRVTMASIGEAELESPGLQEFKFAETPSGIRIHRHEFPVISSKEWFGNWCWNRYWLAREDAKRLLRLLRSKGWRTTCAPEHFWNWMNGASA